MKRARSPQVQDDAISDQERASSRRRTSGSSSLDNVQPVAGHNRQSVTSQASEGDAEVDGDDHEESVKSNAESASSLQDWDDPSAVVESFSPNPWGFVVYRTVYGDEDAWHAFRLKLNTIIGEQREFIGSEGADPQSMTLEFIEDEATLNNATSQQIRLLFNPNYKARPKDNDDEDESQEPPPTRDDGLCEDVCLMIDAAAMHSINHHSQQRPGYVIAIDADSEESEQWTAKEGSETEMVQCEYDGTMKVHLEYFLTEFYLRSIKDQVLTMGEIHGKPDAVWSGLDFGDDA